jgi:hypothetical protein
MIKSSSARALLAGTATVALVLAAISSGTAAAAPPRAPAAVAAATTAAGHGVIVVLKDQHTNLAIAKGHSSPRVLAAQQDQTPVIAMAQRAGVRNIHGFKALNGFAATANPAQIAQLSADPSVAAVYPDLQIKKPVEAAIHAAAAATATATPPASVCPKDPSKPLLEPEALQLTNTAFSTPTTPQAQNLVTGAGVKVAFLADGIDINNPDFIRADGSHVFTDYQDFSGEGPDGPSSAEEAFGDASSIAAQGRQVYDLSAYVNVAHPLPTGCNIQIRGIAPGASLVGLKVFGNAPTAPTSRFIEAIDYAVNVAGVDVINESFGSNPYPDNGNDPITLADNAAVDAGVTVVASSGDAGTTGTIGSPASGGKAISVAATTSFQSYAQTTESGFQFSNGTWASNNISGLSSGGVTQQGTVPDLAAPGDLGWALCTPNTAIYADCTDNNGAPSDIKEFGGTSQASPFTAGAAALVIQAYEQAHHGARPAPALVKRFITSTATDLGHPAYEQGAGLLNTLAAVKAAMSWKDVNGSPAPQGTALVVDKSQLSVSGNPGSRTSSSLTIRNVSRNTQTVALSTRTLGRIVSSKTGTVSLNTVTAPAYIDSFGISRSWVAKKFTVPVGVDRLDVSIAAVSAPFSGRIILIDPHGVYSAYSIPQGAANYAHSDVRYPGFGQWTAYFALSTSSGFNGPIRYGITTSKFTTYGSVSPSRITLAPGASRTVSVKVPLGAQPGDLSASVQLSTNLGLTTSVPLTTFTGVITGGNGRALLPGQTNIYDLDVPKGQSDLGVGVRLDSDPTDLVFGILTAPDGQVYSYQTNEEAGAKTPNDVGFQMYRRNPTPGRWIFSLVTANPVSGLELQQHFTVKVSYNSVHIWTPGLPDSARTTLQAGRSYAVPVKVKNTSAVPLTYFADGRLSKSGDIPLAELSGDSTFALPQSSTVNPLWLVPTEVTQTTFATSADQPVNMDVFYNSGEPEVYSAAQGNGATVQINAAQVSPGLWITDIGQTGPFAGPSTPGIASVAAVAHGQLFDPAVTSSTGDIWLQGVDRGTNAAIAAMIKAGHRKLGAAAGSDGSVSMATASAADTAPAPLTLAPGATGTIMVTVTPSGRRGSVVSGHVDIDTFNFVTTAGDELISLPYTYKIG